MRERLANFNARFFVEAEQTRCYFANGCERLDCAAIDAKMGAPPLAARIEQRHQPPGSSQRCDVTAFSQIALGATVVILSECQDIFWLAFGSSGRSSKGGVCGTRGASEQRRMFCG